VDNQKLLELVFVGCFVILPFTVGVFGLIKLYLDMKRGRR